MTMRVILVDDEPLALTLLASILEDVADVEILAQCRNGYEAIDAVMAHQPDIMFLDIHMPGLNGFEVISKIENDILPLVIFTTAYADYAVEAFQVQAIDYVLKPLEDQAIMTALKRARIRNEVGGKTEEKAMLLTTLHAISEKINKRSGVKPKSTLIVKDSEKFSLLDMQSICWIEAAGDYICIHSEGSTRLIRATLKSVENDIDETYFQRIHRSTIINIRHLSELIPAQKGEAIVKMKDGAKLKVSRKYGSIIRSKLT